MGLLKTGWKYIAQEKEAVARPLGGQWTDSVKNSTGQELGKKLESGPSCVKQTSATGLRPLEAPKKLLLPTPHSLDISLVSENCHQASIWEFPKGPHNLVISPWHSPASFPLLDPWPPRDTICCWHIFRISILLSPSDHSKLSPPQVNGFLIQHGSEMVRNEGIESTWALSISISIMFHTYSSDLRNCLILMFPVSNKLGQGGISMWDTEYILIKRNCPGVPIAETSECSFILYVQPTQVNRIQT